MRPRPSYLDRYRKDGLEDSVWWELMRAGPLEEGTALWEDAYAVARETMHRARQNVERIVGFLQEHRYLFGTISGHDHTLRLHEPWTPPSPDTGEHLARLTALVGPLPLSLRAWWEVVGAVTLQGAFPQEWEAKEEIPMNDPLFIRSLEDVLQDAEEEEDPALRGTLQLAPDVYIKANVSGGAPYTVVVPDGRADTPLRYVRVFLPAPPDRTVSYEEVEVNETLVEYLRRSFCWAGFPGYAFVPQNYAPRSSLDLLAPLIPNLLPL